MIVFSSLQVLFWGNAIDFLEWGKYNTDLLC